jgi:phosphopantetheine--protein transferase-like protein
MRFEIGTDIESTDRIRRLYDHKPTLLARIFYKSELSYAGKKKRPWETLTGIWCSKEAVLKAFAPFLELSIDQIEISHHQKGYPIAHIHHKSIHQYSYQISLSISHADRLATAVALVSVKDVLIHRVSN